MTLSPLLKSSASISRKVLLIPLFSSLFLLFTPIQPAMAAGAQVIASIPSNGTARNTDINMTTGFGYITNLPEDNVAVFNLQTNQFVAAIPSCCRPNYVTVNPTMNRVYVTNLSNNTVSVINGSTNTVIDTVNVGQEPQQVGVNPVTNRFYVPNSAVGDSTLMVFDGSSDAHLDTIHVGSRPIAVSINPSTQRIYTANYDASTVSVIDATTDAVIDTISTGPQPQGMAIDKVTNRIYTANTIGNSVTVIDASTDGVITTIPVPSSPVGVGINEKLNRIYVSSSDNRVISIIDGQTDQIIDTVTNAGASLTVPVNADTSRLYVANGTGGVNVIADQSPIQKQLTALAPATVWINKNIADVLGKYDLKAEVYKDTTLVSTGQLQSVDPGLLTTTSFSIPFNTFTPLNFPQGSTLKIQVYARNACQGSLFATHNVTLHYNSAAHDSRFGATIGNTNTTYHLLNGFLLGTSADTTEKTVAVTLGSPCGPFKSFGTWTVTP